MVKQLGLRSSCFLGLRVTHDEKFLPFPSMNWERLRGFFVDATLKIGETRERV